MSILQYFSKNFFSKIFPDKYFQKKTDIPPVPPDPDDDRPVLTKTSGGYHIEEEKKVNILIKGILCNTYINLPLIEILKKKETEEHLMQLLTILFETLDEDITFTKNKQTENEKAIVIIMDTLL